MLCKICNHQALHFASAKIIDKYDVQYYQCQNCRFVQTEEPYWLAEVYTDAINDSDIGLIRRNIKLARITRSVIMTMFNTEAKFVDYGGGYGLFVRLMRDAGLDYYRYDKWCDNLFAKGFDADVDDMTHYELITAFEVFEHLANPLTQVEQMLQLSRNILFSTELFPANNPKPNEWSYYGLDHGQHLSFYTFETLSFVAQKFDLNLYSDGRFLHLFTEKKIVPSIFKVVSHHKIAMGINFFLRKRSLLADDYFKLTGRPLS